MKKTKSALFNSMIALLLCAAMLLGTTFAWFTDEVTSTGNIIKTGTLDVKMTWSDKVDGTYKDASEGAIFNYRHWEPGYVDVKYVKIENVGSLAFKFRLDVIPASEARDGEVNLADVIDVYIFDATATVDRAAIDAAEPVGTMSDLMADVDGAAYGVLLPAEDVRATNVELNAADANFAVTGSVTYCIVLKMQEDAGNEYQDKTLGNGFAVQLLATQYGYEQDSFGNDYDNNATFPGDFAASAPVTVTNGAVSEPATVGQEDGINAAVPAGVKVADGATELALTVNKLRNSEANIELERGETKTSLDIHMEGVAEDNTVPMLISLPGLMATGLNTTSVAMYHVENGVTVPMTLVTNPTNHNEFSYDPATGDVVLCVATFSEYVTVTDNKNLWEGDAATTFAGGSGTETDPYLIANAQQLAYFGVCVDNGNDFAGKYVALSDDIDLGGTISFNPIGCGYVNGTTNSGSVTGHSFMGTFDGRSYTISNLYQNGWELGLSYCNLGGGLFASVCDATIKNLTITGANVVMECVEQGILVGLSQGNCTYDNIKIYNSKVANYQKATGGLIGETSAGPNGGGTTTIKNVTIGPDVVVGSLWGDFDAPVGGVIGARWDDSNTTKVVMENVTVACRLDVYNDVTSSYQWYAYRRAGMLIGNTDQSTDRTATADFLKCTNVVVYYGPWVNYHYCEFNNHNSNWPWVRVEEGENCSAYSNPRYGVPNDPVTKQPVTNLDHNHSGDDEHNVELQFNQLYGGGQGVYGQPKHDGVEVINYRYSITYVNDYQVLAIKYVTESGAVDTANDVAKKLVEDWAKVNIGENKFVFGGWMNAGSTKLTQIDADNTKDIVLYPYFNNPYTARFVDQNGNVVAYCFFHKEDITKLEDTRILAEAALPDLGEDMEFDYWEVHITDNEGKVTSKETYSASKFAGYNQDVTIYPVYLFKGDVNLVPVDTDSDGIIDHYQVAGYSDPNGQAMVEIPASVNGKPILQINQNAFSGYDGVHSIVVPNGVTIGKNAFTKGNSFGSGEEITIYFEGTKDQWDKLTKETGWDYGIGTGSRVFFLKDGKVNTAEGYLEVVDDGWFLDHNYQWSEKTDFASVKNTYTGTCNCSNPTTGDTAHVYKDADGNVMNHNDEGTPIGNNGNVITFKAGSWGREDKLTDGTTDTYKRYRPDTAYWEGVTIS